MANHSTSSHMAHHVTEIHLTNHSTKIHKINQNSESDMDHHFSDYILPSIMLLTIFIYCILIFVLLKDRKIAFNSSFFSLFASTGIADVFNLLIQVFLIDLPSLFFSKKWIKLAQHLPLATVTNALVWYVNYVQIIGLVAISANRFSAIALPVWYEKLWTNGKLKIIVALQWLLPILSVLPMAFPVCKAKYFNRDPENMDFASETVLNVYSIIDFIIEALFCAPFVVVMNFMAVVISVRNRHRIANAESEISQGRRKAELRLLIVGIIISASYVSSVVFITLCQLAYKNLIPLNGDQMMIWYYNTFDIFTICNPYILLILSEVTRKAFFSFILCKKETGEGRRRTLTAATVRPLPSRLLLGL